MKHYTKLLFLSLIAAMATLVGCEEDKPIDTPVDPLEGARVELQLVSADINDAVVMVNTEVVKHIAYTITKTADKAELTAEELFATGDVEVCDEDGSTQIKFNRLEASTEYTVQVAARISSKHIYDQVSELKFTTAEAPVIPEMEVSLVSTTATTAEIMVEVENISRYAYLACRVADDGSVEAAPNAPLLFVKGVICDCVAGQNTLLIERLSPKAEYVIYFAAEIAGKDVFMEEIITLTGIKTADFEQDVRIYDIHSKGFSVDLKVDKEAFAELNHVIKMQVMDVFSYHNHVLLNEYDIMGDNVALDFHSLTYPQNVFAESTSFSIYSDLITPGQPEVLIMGEYGWGKDKYGGWSHAKPMMDTSSYYWSVQSDPSIKYNQAPYWTGFYYNNTIITTEPEVLNEEIEYTIDATSDNATITFKPNDNIHAYCVSLLPESLYYDLLNNYLMGNEDYMQWFVTSYTAGQENLLAKTMIYDGQTPCYVKLTDLLNADAINPSETYHISVTALGGDISAEGIILGNKQKYHHGTFNLPAYSKPAPAVVITAGESTPTTVKWNIKCTSGDAREVEYLCNYERDWMSSGGISEENVKALLSTYGGAPLDAISIDAINSPNGLDIEFYSKSYTTSYLAVKVTNDEGRVTISSAVPSTSLPEVPDTPVEIPALDGDWTMTATVATESYVDEVSEETVWVEREVTSKVTIGTSQLEVPDEMPDEAVGIYESVGVEEEFARAYYQQFKEALDVFIDTHKGQNRILLNGWDMDPTGGFDTRYSTPYDLFISTTYSGYSSTSPIYDFGPKWFIEFDAEGNAWVPYNIDYYGTMSSWTTYKYSGHDIVNEYYLMAANQKRGYVKPYENDYVNETLVDGKFPVEISDDGNTITIKGNTEVVNGEELVYYPNMATYSVYSNQTYITIYAYIVSDIVLTKGWNESTEAQKMGRNQKSHKAVAQTVASDYKAPEKVTRGQRSAWPEKEDSSWRKELKWITQQ